VATEEEHLNRGRANLAFARRLSTVDSTEAAWKVTASFYAALHFVEATLVRRGLAGTTHVRRRDLMAAEPALRHVRAEYRTLEDASRDARYAPEVDFANRKDTQALCDLADAIRASLGY
jgi:hypothetical protein